MSNREDCSFSLFESGQESHAVSAELTACRKIGVVRNNEHYQDIRAKGTDFLLLKGRISALTQRRTTFFNFQRVHLIDTEKLSDPTHR
jgi:hypothetical protein